MDTEQKKPMLRASDETRQQLKIIAALTHETMQTVLARLVRTELEQVTQSNREVGSEEKIPPCQKILPVSEKLDMLP